MSKQKQNTKSDSKFEKKQFVRRDGDKAAQRLEGDTIDEIYGFSRLKEVYDINLICAYYLLSLYT